MEISKDDSKSGVEVPIPIFSEIFKFPIISLFPAKVWSAVVTMPPLVASAGARFNSPEVTVAPFGSEEVLIAPTVAIPPLDTEPSAIKYSVERPFCFINELEVILPAL